MRLSAFLGLYFKSSVGLKGLALYDGEAVAVVGLALLLLPQAISMTSGAEVRNSFFSTDLKLIVKHFYVVKTLTFAKIVNYNPAEN